MKRWIQLRMIERIVPIMDYPAASAPGKPEE
jgi:hypothetical protein